MRALLPALLVAMVACGCSTWRPLGLTPEAVVAREHPERLRVVCMARGQVELDGPHVEGDSLVGTVDGVRTAIALRSVIGVEARRRATGERIVIPLLVGFGLTAVAFAGWE